MFKQANDQAAATAQAKRPFGTTFDPVEAGRRGGRASALSRRLRPIRELERGIAESNNGAAKVALLRQKRQEMAAVEREQIRLDRLVCDLLDQADAERKTIARLRDRRRHV